METTNNQDSSFLSVEDMDRIAKQEEARLAKLCFVKGDSIVLNVQGRYEVAFNRCDTLEKTLKWIMHLTGKTWMTAELVHRFIELACERHGLDPYGID